MLKERINSLDYLRGLMALSIMLFHVFTWQAGAIAAGNILGRLGIYGVSVFYILSGLTLYKVYEQSFSTEVFLKDIADFFRKRFFRIIPLLALVSLATFAVSDKKNLTELLLNVTGLFGFVAPERYIAVGAWSIGNELVFYIFFPPAIILLRHVRWLFYVLFAGMVGLAAIFCFSLIPASSQLSDPDSWKMYVNPFNQIFLFFGGITIGNLLSGDRLRLIRQKAGSKLYFVLLFFVLIFVLYPVGVDEISLVIGWNRLVLSFASIGITLAVYLFPLGSDNVLERVLKFLGDISYSTYLLHPLCFFFFKRLLHIESSWVIIPTSIIATLVAGYVVYTYFEKPFMKLGRRRKPDNKIAKTSQV